MFVGAEFGSMALAGVAVTVTGALSAWIAEAIAAAAFFFAVSADCLALFAAASASDFALAAR